LALPSFSTTLNVGLDSGVILFSALFVATLLKRNRNRLMEWVGIIALIAWVVFANRMPSQKEHEAAVKRKMEELESEPLVRELRTKITDLTEENNRLSTELVVVKEDLSMSQYRIEIYEQKYGYE
jgi:hypothetical protein